MKIPCQCPRCLTLITHAIVREMLGDQNGADYLMSHVTAIEVPEGNEGYADTWAPAVPAVDSESLN